MKFEFSEIELAEFIRHVNTLILAKYRIDVPNLRKTSDIVSGMGQAFSERVLSRAYSVNDEYEGNSHS